MNLLEKMRAEYAATQAGPAPTKTDIPKGPAQAATPSDNAATAVQATVSEASSGSPVAPATAVTATAAPTESALDKLKRMKGSQINPPTPVPPSTAAPPRLPSVSDSANSVPASEALTATAGSTAVASTAVALAEEKKRKPKAEKGMGLVVMVNALYAKAPDGLQVQQLSDLLLPLIKRVCDENKVAHPGLIDYKKGWSALAAYLDQEFAKSRPSGIIIADSRTDEYAAVASILTSYADVVVRGA